MKTCLSKYFGARVSLSIVAMLFLIPDQQPLMAQGFGYEKPSILDFRLDGISLDDDEKMEAQDPTISLMSSLANPNSVTASKETPDSEAELDAQPTKRVGFIRLRSGHRARGANDEISKSNTQRRKASTAISYLESQRSISISGVDASVDLAGYYESQGVEAICEQIRVTAASDSRLDASFVRNVSLDVSHAYVSAMSVPVLPSGLIRLDVEPTRVSEEREQYDGVPVARLSEADQELIERFSPMFEKSFMIELVSVDTRRDRSFQSPAEREAALVRMLDEHVDRALAPVEESPVDGLSLFDGDVALADSSEDVVSKALDRLIDFRLGRVSGESVRSTEPEELEIISDQRSTVLPLFQRQRRMTMDADADEFATDPVVAVLLFLWLAVVLGVCLASVVGAASRS